eukprot:snap_masked-scaffold_57-processed-gene-1.12-mRNA-1 protein AED:0.09 eAED:0.35 QI:0/0/0.5/1/1/1/2/77/62
MSFRAPLIKQQFSTRELNYMFTLQWYRSYDEEHNIAEEDRFELEVKAFHEQFETAEEITILK